LTNELVLLFVGVTFLSTLTGGLFTLRNSRLQVKYFFAFAAGALLGVSFFDIFPEIIALLESGAVDTTVALGTVVVAFLFFHILDRSITIHSLRSHPDGDRGRMTNGRIRASGLSIHSFLDGVAIGTAFHIGLTLGVLVGLAVVFHDFSDGLNTVTVMLRAGAKSRPAFYWLLTDSVTPVVGAASTFLFFLSDTALALLLAFFVGEFLFIGAADLLPEAHESGTSFRLVLATLLGVLLIFGVTRFV
jgi:zinc transporter ZupT